MSRKFLVIGGNSGIGAATIKILTGQGDEAIAASREKEGHSVPWQFFDASEPDAGLDLPDKLDGLVYCPGTIVLKPFHRFTDEDYLSDWKVNFLGAVHAIQQSLSALKEAENSSIVLFSTVAVQTGLSYHASIAGAKGAVEGLARTLAAELSPKIRVNCIAPSLTDTPLAESLLNSEEKKKASADRHPLKRVGSAEEVGKAVAFLLSPDAGFITGQILQIDGGISTLKML